MLLMVALGLSFLEDAECPMSENYPLMNPCANENLHFLDTAYLIYESRERYNFEFIHPDMSVTENSLSSRIALLG